MSQIKAVWHFYLFGGVLIGAGIGGVFVAIMSTIARWFDKRRSAMTGIVMAGGGVGVFIGPPVTNELVSL